MASILAATRNLLRKFSGNALLNIYSTAGKKDTLVCQFNPEEYHITAQGKYSTEERPNKDSPIIQYIGGSVTALNLSLIFDTSASTETTLGLMTTSVKNNKATDVSDYIAILFSLVRVAGELHRPPAVEFTWGSLYLCGFTQSIDVTYTMFERGGMPVRAKVKLGIVSPNLEELSQPLQSPDRTKCRVLTEGTNIWSIAQAEYDDAGYWREIAKANQIMDPLAVPIGTVLKIPALDL